MLIITPLTSLNENVIIYLNKLIYYNDDIKYTNIRLFISNKIATIAV